MTFANKFALSKNSFPRLFKFSKRSSRKSSPRRKALHFPQILDRIRIIHFRPYRTDAKFCASVRRSLNSPSDSFCRNNRTPTNGLADEFHLVVCFSRLPSLIKSRVISLARTQTHTRCPEEFNNEVCPATFLSVRLFVHEANPTIIRHEHHCVQQS